MNAVEASFAAFAERATGFGPYDYQSRIACSGLPELLSVPTGCGKTMAAVLPWLFRRRVHDDVAVRETTPHWLVFVLPMRVLVEQTEASVREWVENLGLTDEVGVHVVMGGEGKLDGAWRLDPARDAIFIGTMDMLISRALNRGYGESRFAWPIDFGLFNTGCQWVFDEVQLMGAALAASRQLHGLRAVLGTAAPCASMWMSATVDREALATIDCPHIATDVRLADDERSGALAARLGATRRVEELVVPDDTKKYEKDIATALTLEHEAGTLTLAILNTVDRARKVSEAISALSDAEVVLLHSRFRRADRKRQVVAALAAVDPEGPGRIIVSTQVVEAGVDISAALMFSEAAPWPSIVQRAGRCNRDGTSPNARLVWIKPAKLAPYTNSDIEASVLALKGLEGRDMTGDALGKLSVPTTRVQHDVLRRRDLIDLFDTTPDLGGNDVDVSRFIRDEDDLSVQLAWRDFGGDGPSDAHPPTSAELCAVPVTEAREFVKNAGDKGAVWRFDHLDDRRWVRCFDGDVRPGAVLLANCSAGGYSPESGWSPKSDAPVEPVVDQADSALVPSVEATADEGLSERQHAWLGLRDHLADVEFETRRIVSELKLIGLKDEHIEAAAVAARLHDVGKAHPVFQDTLTRTCSDGEEPAFVGPWAKSAGSLKARHRRKYFRHELVSALMLLGEASTALDEVGEKDLVRYLVAAHHGRVRLGIRSLPGETRNERDFDGRVALGVFDGDPIPAVDIPDGRLPECVVDLAFMELGDRPDGSPSWSARMLVLRDRPDLGPFRLAFLEALVRLGDWKASAAPGGGSRW